MLLQIGVFFCAGFYLFRTFKGFIRDFFIGTVKGSFIGTFMDWRTLVDPLLGESGDLLSRW